MKINDSTTDKFEYNSSLILSNLLDEIDWVVGGYGKPTPQFLYSLNAFIESYVLNDKIFISYRDFSHLNLASPLFPNGRPILEMLISNQLLSTIFETNKHLDADIGTVIYAFQLIDDSSLEKGEWFRQYQKDVDIEYLRRLLFNYNLDNAPKSTPLLLLGGEGKDKAVCVFERTVEKCLDSVLSLSLGSSLHPILPIYALESQAKYLKSISFSHDLCQKLSNRYNVKTEEITKYCGYSRLPLPPFVSILLSRCKTKDDLPSKLHELRTEYICLRNACREHEFRLSHASTIKEQIEIIKEFNEFWELFTKKDNERSSRLFYRIWDIAKYPKKLFQEIIDLLIVKGTEKQVLNRFKGFPDIWNLSLNAPSVQNQLLEIERIFGSPVSPESWNAYTLTARKIEREIFPDK